MYAASNTKNAAADHHNLNVESYSLQELLALFDIASYQISLEDMRRAKKKMLMTHPDQSRLPSSYYLFYRQAYEVVLTFYQEQTRQQQSTQNVKDYVPSLPTSSRPDETVVKQQLDTMSAGDFQSRFNRLFDEMGSMHKPDPQRNAWFTQADPVLPKVPDRVANIKDMGHAFHTIKTQQQAVAMTHYRGVQDMVVSQGTASLYDDDDDDENPQRQTEYVSSDVFSKLKYDDLRKVHKDQTMFAVSETDYVPSPSRTSVDRYARERDASIGTPLNELEAQRMLQENARIHRERMMQREYAAMQKEKENERKSQALLSQFLLLKR